MASGAGLSSDPNRIRERLSSAGRHGVALTLAPMAASLVTQAWLGRELGRVGLGEYHAASLYVTVLTSVLLLGLPTTIAQRVAALEEAGDPAADRAANAGLALTILFGSAIAILATVAWAPFVRLFGLRGELTIEAIFLATLAASVTGFAAFLFLAKLEGWKATGIVIAQPFGVAAAIASGYSGLIWSGVLLAAIGFIVSGCVAVILLGLAGIRPVIRRGEAVGLLSRSLPSSIVTYPSLITGWIDRAIIGIVLGPAALGAFVAASTLVEALHRTMRAVGAIAVPAYARLSTDPIGAGRVLDSHLRVLAAAFVVAGSVFIAAGNGMLTLLFGESFAIATTTLRLLAITLVPLGIAVALASQSVGSGANVGATRVLLLLVPTQFVASTVATTIFHIAGTALADLVVWSVGAYLYFAHARRQGAPVQVRTLLHIAGVSIPLFMVSWIVGLQPIGWPERAMVSIALAAPVVLVVLIRAPELRLMRRLLWLS